ncbi:putative ferulic acid esterase [Xylariales sp. AK1849]|nr:putative ferulic acid esterase [Xylariales sp. AK1849]
MQTVLFSVLIAATLGGLATAAPSAGCNGNFTVPTLETLYTADLAVNKSRSYVYWLPPTYDPSVPAPIIFSFHGIRQTPDKQAALDQFVNARFNNNSIAVYPQAVAQGGRDEVMWQGPRTAKVDDVTFVMQIIDELEENFCVDTDRIYASGKSEGAGFVGILACNDTSNARIAAFAPVSGAFYPGTNKGTDDGCKDKVEVPCATTRCNIPFLEFHGGADFLAPFEGGEQRQECLPNIPDYMAEWVARDKLDATPTVTYNLSSVATLYKYDEAGTVTFVYDGNNVGHDWPWTVPNPDTKRAHSKPSTFNATSIIMDWFSNFTLAHTDACNASSVA